jgi:hypothetical protein
MLCFTLALLSCEKSHGCCTSLPFDFVYATYLCFCLLYVHSMYPPIFSLLLVKASLPFKSTLYRKRRMTHQSKAPSVSVRCCAGKETEFLAKDPLLLESMSCQERRRQWIDSRSPPSSRTDILPERRSHTAFPKGDEFHTAYLTSSQLVLASPNYYTE